VAIYYLSLIGAILFGVAGQITIAAQFINPMTILGFGIYVLAAFCYIVALKKLPVSVAFPSVAASYAVVAVIAHWLWNEPFGWTQIGGLLLISGGIVLLHQH
jgi:small multidrug resistance pump